MIPDYQSIYQPLLKLLSDDGEHPIREIINQLGNHFKLTEEERKVWLPSGNAILFDNRVHWARTYLSKAGLLYNPRRGVVKITEEGKRVISSGVISLNNKFLRQYEGFNSFQTQKKQEKDLPASAEQNEEDTLTPEEVLEQAHTTINDELGRELLEKVLASSPQFFERLVVQLLVKMGYGGSLKEAGKATRSTKDEGIDGVIRQDKLGLDIIYIQAKRWKAENTVSRPELQKFVGALAGRGAKKGIFITTSSFTKDAAAYSARNETKIVLIDGMELQRLMIEFNVGCTLTRSFDLKKLDPDYFDEL